ncbi:MAG: oxidoreductase [Alphaproteobacteria bacterium HGW-Alphaproteobacteria-16]|nr:MAG: oxidoreductase [Alphaproteobacteria bacterium HGW-Alphaproteobacteria-16]
MTTSPAHLLTLGMFVFGMDTMAYDDLVRRINWRHPESERFGARAASQFAGPGEDTITMSGTLVPEIAGSYSAIETLIEMGDTGDDYPLLDGLGRVLGQFRIEHFEESHRAIMAGGIPRAKTFVIDLRRAD